MIKVVKAAARKDVDGSFTASRRGRLWTLERYVGWIAFKLREYRTHIVLPRRLYVHTSRNLAIR